MSKLIAICDTHNILKGQWSEVLLVDMDNFRAAGEAQLNLTYMKWILHLVPVKNIILSTLIIGSKLTF